MSDNLRKVCDCSSRKWSRCGHSWYLNFMYKGVHHRISLDKHAGKTLENDEAKALADELKTAIRKGAYRPPPVVVAPVVTPSAETFAAFGTLWLEREREGRIADWRSDRSRLSQLGKVTVGDGTLAERPIGRITADDLEVAFRALEANGITGQTLNKYLQVCQHLQKWGVKRAVCCGRGLTPATRIRVRIPDEAEPSGSPLGVRRDR